MWKPLFFLLFVSLFLTACADSFSGNNNSNLGKDWLIPANEVYDGGPGKDGIPALSNPAFVSPAEATYLSSSSRVLVYKNDNNVRIYPHAILNWHEIINDNVSGTKITISYCPLTGSGIGYESKVEQEGISKETTFGVSGLLYNTNLILYDRLTDSYWSQMRLQCVGGELKGQYPDFVPLLETSFASAKQMFPTATVVSSNTSIYSENQYKRYPYGDYRTNNNNLIFPVSPDDNRLPRKERVLGIVSETVKRVYRFKNFSNSIQVINDDLGGIPVVIAGSKSFDFISAFRRPSPSVTMQETSLALPAVMEDSNGNIYSVLGEVIQGAALGSRLKTVQSFTAFWFSFGAFYPGIEIYGE